MTSWYLQPILDNYAWAAGAAALLVLLLLVAPRFRSLSRRRRSLLIGLRLLVILLLLLALLRPTRVSTTKEPKPATLLIQFDQSRSMRLPNESGGRSRWEAQRALLQSAQPLLAEMAKNMEVKLYAYDTALHGIDASDGVWQWPAQADGQQTDIGSTLSEALHNELGKRLAGVVLLGDGVQTAFDPKVEVQEAGRELARLGYPLYTVAFGPAGDAAQGRDVAVENLPDQYTVFVKNELQVRGTVRVRGYVNKEIPVELVVENQAGEQKTLGPLRLIAREDGQQLDADFTYTPPEPGQYKLTLRAAEQAGELVTKNNQLSAFLTVLEGGLKILYLEGDLRLEQKFLRRSIDASPDMELDFQYIDARQRSSWPIDLGSILKNTHYDAFVLGDLDSQALGEANLKALAKTVEQGKGLVMLGGFHSFGPGGYFGTPLADVLPIKMNRFERQNFDEPVRRDLQIEGPLTMLPTRPQAITQLAGGDENLRVWKSLPPLSGANRFADIKESAGVQVLAATPQGVPLLVTGEYGQGRVLAFAGDSTWRWWMQGRQAEHRRFWRQVILWLTRRDDLVQHDVWIKLAQRRFPPGSKITFTAGAKTAAGDVVRDATYQAELVSAGGRRQQLLLVAEGDHITGVVDSAKEPGDYQIELVASAEGKKLGTARAEFMVFDQDVELSNPAADHDQLARLANMTQEFGGRPVAPEQFAALLHEIHQRAGEFEVEVQTKWQFADTAVDAWSFLLALAALLGIEWGLRKKWGLV